MATAYGSANTLRVRAQRYTLLCSLRVCRAAIANHRADHIVFAVDSTTLQPFTIKFYCQYFVVWIRLLAMLVSSETK